MKFVLQKLQKQRLGSSESRDWLFSVEKHNGDSGQQQEQLLEKLESIQDT